MRNSRLGALVLSIGVAAMYAGCAKQLTKELSANICPLGYMMDSKSCALPHVATVKITGVEDSSGLKDFNEAKVKFTFGLPLVIVNFWTTLYQCTIGRSAFDQGIGTFIKKSINAESARSGCFQLTESDSADYTCTLVLRKASVEGPFSSYFVIYFALYVYGYVYGHSAGPGTSDVAVTMIMRKRDGTTVRKEYSSLKKAEALQANRNSLSEMQSNFVNGLAEAFSVSVKECVEQCVIGINAEIGQR